MASSPIWHPSLLRHRYLIGLTTLLLSHHRLHHLTTSTSTPNTTSWHSLLSQPSRLTPATLVFLVIVFNPLIILFFNTISQSDYLKSGFPIPRHPSAFNFSHSILHPSPILPIITHLNPYHISQPTSVLSTVYSILWYPMLPSPHGLPMISGASNLVHQKTHPALNLSYPPSSSTLYIDTMKPVSSLSF